MEDTEKDPIPPETIQEISLKAGEKARNSRWDLNIAIFLFAVLICVIILVTYTNAGPEIAAPAAAVGLSLVWFTGWRRGKQLYRIYYTEEINRVKRERKCEFIVGVAEEQADEDRPREAPGPHRAVDPSAGR